MTTTPSPAPAGPAKLRLGTAPDSWGVWFPEDPHQVSWKQCLDEVAQAGYRWLELGPYGFLPTDPDRLRAELDARGITLTGGAVFAGLHRGAAALDQAIIDCDQEARLLTALGAEYLVLLPEGYTDLDGNLTQPSELTDGQWTDLTTGMDTLGKHLLDTWGVQLVFHPHADSHVDTQEHVIRFLDYTDPRYVNLCLDTGHLAYCGADNLAIIKRYPERVQYVHLKQVDPAIRRRVLDEKLGFAPAVRLGAMVEPPDGEPAMEPIIAALGELDRELFCIVEQDMYPCAPDVPLPIAIRTRQFFAGCGLGSGRALTQPTPRTHSRTEIQATMTIRVGVIGTGGIGTDHAQRLASGISGATVAAVTDIDRARAEQVAGTVGGASVHADGFELIASDEVDAVVITSIGETHAAFTLACIAAGKPVLCEKPLAPTTPECVQVLEAEMAFGRRLVIVGFMRRYDPGYRAVRAARTDGSIGQPLMLHNIHRNPEVPDSFTSFMTITDAIIHEIDVTRWLLDEEITAIQVIPPARSPKAAAHLQDPQFAALHTESGVLSTVSFFANCTYGYDVRCELTGSEGVASMINPVTSAQLLGGAEASPIPSTWRDRFGAAYHAEIQEWIHGLLRGETVGPSAWDGYAATRVAEAGVEAVRTGERVLIDYIEKPALYA